MNFTRIDLDNWKRKALYEQFLKNTPCTYSMTVNLDVSHFYGECKRAGYAFFSTFLYGLCRVVNAHEEFRMDYDDKGHLGYYNMMHPCCAVFEEDELFSAVPVEYCADLSVFSARYIHTMQTHKAQHGKTPSANSPAAPQVMPKNIFNVSCIPWVSFTGFNLNLQKGYNYLPPIFTLGKYTKTADGKMNLPLAVQVNHAVCDGFHVSRLINELQGWADEFYA